MWEVLLDSGDDFSINFFFLLNFEGIFVCILVIFIFLDGTGRGSDDSRFFATFIDFTFGVDFVTVFGLLFFFCRQNKITKSKQKKNTFTFKSQHVSYNLTQNILVPVVTCYDVGTYNDISFCVQIPITTNFSPFQGKK